MGMSGTSETSVKHYYYDCQTKRKEKTCLKKAVRRDWIEQKVAEAVKQYIMLDEIIQWLATGYDSFVKRSRKDSLLAAAETELEGVNKAIKNVMSAIEQGIITSATKERLMELEDERRQLEATVAVERAALMDISKEQVGFWLASFREGDITDKKYQEKLINSFIQAVYLYDDEMRMVFSFSNRASQVVLSLEDINNLGSDETLESSYKFADGSPEKKTR